MLLHQPDVSTIRSSSKLEGGQARGEIQERCVPPAQGFGREGCQASPSSIRRKPHNIVEGASRLHRCPCGWPLQAKHLPVLNRCSRNICQALPDYIVQFFVVLRHLIASV